MSNDSTSPGSGLFGRWLSATVRPVNGFQWMSAEGWKYDDPLLRWRYEPDDRGPWLVPVDGPNPPMVAVEVLNDPRRAPDPDSGVPGFHRIFAKLADGRGSTRQDRALTFANRYGFLGERPTHLVRGSDDHGTHPAEVTDGESWAFWENAIFEVAAAVALWDRVQAKDSHTLAGLVQWYRRPYASVDCMYRRGKLFSQWDFSKQIDDPDEWRGGAGILDLSVILEECEEPPEPWIGSSVEAARQALYDHVTLRLNGQVTPYLDRLSDTELWFLPRTLLAAVYLHLAREISGRHRLAIPCANPRCGRYFVPNRSTARYCSKACRQQDAYHRAKQHN